MVPIFTITKIRFVFLKVVSKIRVKHYSFCNGKKKSADHLFLLWVVLKGV